jgi:hypothetical protein
LGFRPIWGSHFICAKNRAARNNINIYFERHPPGAVCTSVVTRMNIHSNEEVSGMDIFMAPPAPPPTLCVSDFGCYNSMRTWWQLNENWVTRNFNWVSTPEFYCDATLLLGSHFVFTGCLLLFYSAHSLLFAAFDKEKYKNQQKWRHGLEERFHQVTQSQHHPRKSRPKLIMARRPRQRRQPRKPAAVPTMTCF